MPQASRPETSTLISSGTEIKQQSCEYSRIIATWWCCRVVITLHRLLFGMLHCLFVIVARAAFGVGAGWCTIPSRLIVVLISMDF
jgi:hypothetical protein